MRIRILIAVPILAASLALPIACYYWSADRLRGTKLALAQQGAELARAKEQSQELARSRTNLNGELSAGELTELLRLRNELGRLRRATNDPVKTPAEIGPTATDSNILADGAARIRSPEFMAELSTETRQAVPAICAALPTALQKFKAEHQEEHISLRDLRGYLPISEGRALPGINSFEFIRPGGPEINDEIILREIGVRVQPDGKFARVYGYRNGAAVEAVSENGDFQDWEKEHMVPARE